MKTDNYTITGDSSDITEIHKVIEKVAQFNDLPDKDLKKLQLLAEELVGMEKGLLGFSKGDFHIETPTTNTGFAFTLT